MSDAENDIGRPRRRSPRPVSSVSEVVDQQVSVVQGGGKKEMFRGCVLRFLLLSGIFGIILFCNLLGLHHAPKLEDNPSNVFFYYLNWFFKRVGWLTTSIMLAILLLTRFYRQHRLAENASWRRHAVVDSGLWTFSWLYWAFIVFYLFPQLSRSNGTCLLPEEEPSAKEWDAKQCLSRSGKWIPLDISGHTFLSSMAICLLSEELIRTISEPMSLFVFPDHLVDSKVQKARVLWNIASSASLLLISIFLLLLIRTALFYHTLKEKLWGAVFGTSFWLFVLAMRFFLR